MKQRILEKTFASKAIAEGQGVTVHRTIGRQGLMKLDPFLLLDEMVIPEGAQGVGFPEHPHRGFETVTYMLSGSMQHKDTAGNSGEISAGEAQWMTAGRGIIHSEMPTSKGTDIRGFQLWVNLPAKDKMKSPRYQDIPRAEIPEIDEDSFSMRLVSGSYKGVTGPVKGIAIDPLFADIHVTDSDPFSIEIPEGHNAFLYAYDGRLSIGGVMLEERSLGILSDGDMVTVSAKTDSKFLLVSGKPINEPVARYGPFVMNTREEIMQTLDDWNSGTFITSP